MITRISSVVACILTVVWLARAPDWEPLAAFVGSILAYIGVEFSHKGKKDKKDERDVPSHSPDEIKDKIGALGDIRALIGQVDSDKRPLREGTPERMLAEHVQKDLERIFKRVQHKFGISDKDAPL